MATRKTTDDSAARGVVARMLAESSDGRISEAEALKPFETAEFEFAPAKIGGAEIQLRRVVLTGPWEVVTK